jgi:hypothetical protein
LIPVEDQSPSYFLGPVGISDPSEFIATESQRIPFKASLSKPHEWQDAFKNWPLPPIAGWRNWYKRMLDDDSPKTSNWDSLRIAHCLELSLVETPQNENLLIAACHFWSNGTNAFLFGHGPMSPTLADVYRRGNGFWKIQIQLDFFLLDFVGLDYFGCGCPHAKLNWMSDQYWMSSSGHVSHI